MTSVPMASASSLLNYLTNPRGDLAVRLADSWLSLSEGTRDNVRAVTINPLMVVVRILTAVILFAVLSMGGEIALETTGLIKRGVMFPSGNAVVAVVALLITLTYWWRVERGLEELLTPLCDPVLSAWRKRRFAEVGPRDPRRRASESLLVAFEVLGPEYAMDRVRAAMGSAGARSLLLVLAFPHHPDAPSAVERDELIGRVQKILNTTRA